MWNERAISKRDGAVIMKQQKFGAWGVKDVQVSSVSVDVQHAPSSALFLIVFSGVVRTYWGTLWYPNQY